MTTIKDFPAPEGWEWVTGADSLRCPANTPTMIIDGEDDTRRIHFLVEKPTFSWEAFGEKAREFIGEDAKAGWRFAQCVAEYAMDGGLVDAKWCLVYAAGLRTEPLRASKPFFFDEYFLERASAMNYFGTTPSPSWPSFIDSQHGPGTAERLAREWMEGR